MSRKLIAIVTIFSLVLIPQAHAFTFMGIDFDELWDRISFWNSEEKSPAQEREQPPKSTKTQSKGTRQSSPKPEIKITLAGTEYTQKTLKSSINTNDDIKGYIRGFGYECIFIETDKGTEFTMQFDPDAGILKSLKNGNSCEREIYLEESLITEITQNGFSAKNIKAYLEKVDLPLSIYGKALKVFTIG